MSAAIPRIHILLDRGRFKDAEALLLESLAKTPDDSILHLLHAQTLCRLERPKEAEEAAKRAIGLDPDDGVPHEILAQALIQSSRWTEAEAAVKQAMELDGEDADRHGLLAKIYFERGKMPVALEHAEAGLAIDPDHDICRFFRGLALGKLGRHEEADATAMSLLSDDPDDSYNHSARAWVLMERGALDEAKLHFKEALRLDPDNNDARIGLARSLQQQHPVLGWFLRLVVRLEKVPMVWLIGFAAVVFFVLPKFLEGPGKPVVLHWLAQTLRTAVGLFFYATLAAQPLFDCLLALSKEGRMALGSYEMRAVRWCALPLIGGIAFIFLWLYRGAAFVPYQGLALIAASVMIHEAFTARHPWVRRRLLGIAALVGTIALWVAFGPFFILDPMREAFLAKLPEALKSAKSKQLPTEFLGELKNFLRVRSWGFAYPALALYFAAAYSDNIANVLLRRAPDESD